MDIEYFLKERTKFIRYFYETSSQPFVRTMADIEAGVEPYTPSYSEDPEPPFLNEWIDAKSAMEISGLHALSMLSSSLQLFLKAWVSRLEDHHGMSFKPDFKSKGWFNGYRQIFKECDLEMEHCPADLAVIEQITLARNRAQHPDHLTSVNVYHSKRDLEKYPNPYFAQQIEKKMALEGSETNWFFPPIISPSKEKVFESINNVESLCSWLESEYRDARNA
ncbi:hypothetical protein [Vibrio sp. TRT 17S01]|uniref:hypothetical protein n=1 Tax=Vibrio sp. TRT 17S01 TaxID=3418505 RepID=UPI003CEE40B4